ncbi:MAG: hypothetical protein HYR60_07290 [Acidobacteria bacterium]|nr:hypothetical protein [Acidobacteriota bacterium]
MATAILLLGLAAVLFIAGYFAREWWKLRGARVIRCPENLECAGVAVDAVHGAFGAPLKLKECTRWPERAGCGQECLRQIETAPDGCLVRNIITQWYEGKTCVYCGQTLEGIRWIEHQPALHSPDGKTVEWREIRPERVHAVLSTHGPVCWNCHVAETFRREHPELVIERPRH